MAFGWISEDHEVLNKSVRMLIPCSGPKRTFDTHGGHRVEVQAGPRGVKAILTCVVPKTQRVMDNEHEGREQDHRVNTSMVYWNVCSGLFPSTRRRDCNRYGKRYGCTYR